MLTEFFASITAMVRGWWLALADQPWQSLGIAILLALLLPLAGFGVGRLLRPRTPRPVAAAADPAAAKALGAVQAERDRLRSLNEASAAEVSGARRGLAAAEEARTAAEAARAEAEAQAAEARRQLAEADSRLLAAETARTDAEAAAAAATGARDAATAETETLRERLADALAAIDGARAEAAKAREESATAIAEAREAARNDIAAARSEMETARAAAAAAAAAEVAAAAERAEAAARTAREDAARIVAEAEARADAAEAEAAEARRVLAEAGDETLHSLADAADAGAAPLAPALAAARAFAAHHGAGLATAQRLEALAALDGTTEGFDRARRSVAAALVLAGGPDPDGLSDLTLLDETLAAAARDPALATDARRAETAGLPRLAEALWLNRAEAGSDPAALAAAAAAALWGGRWPQAVALADRAAAALESFGATAAAVLDARLTGVQARLSAGTPDALDRAAALAADAATAPGVSPSFTAMARRLHARALFEAGQAEAAEAVAAGLRGTDIDPFTDPVLRTARGRGLLASGNARGAKALFEALARQAPDGSRTALGHRLDSLEAALAEAEADAATVDALEALAPAVLSGFGPRHPRAGQFALLRALALADTGARDAAEPLLAEAERLLAPRLDPAHRWRLAAAELHERLAAMPAPDMAPDTAPDTALAPVDEAPSDTDMAEADTNDTEPDETVSDETTPEPASEPAEPAAAAPAPETAGPEAPAEPPRGPWGAYAPAPDPTPGGVR